MQLAKYLILFLIINFGSLAIGSWLMDNGPMSNWYRSLNQAPWTPAGWVFGLAWTSIMVFFSIYLAFLFQQENNVKRKVLYILHIFLNISWNYIFFNQHLVGLGLFTIVLLTIVLLYYFFTFNTQLKKIRLLLVPYLLWLFIATSLNAYILFNN
jgi:tryptophan-rich sensory protein